MSEPGLVLVGGTYKAGTKSLFSYLGAHQRVCACRVKEPGYFLPKAFGFGNSISYESDDVSSFRDLFDTRPEHTYILEATPAYLYSAEAARAVKERYPDAHIVFCLRDPIERLRSWYSMLRHLRRIPDDMTFPDYVGRQIREPAAPARPLDGFPGRGLRDGRYVEALECWLSLFGRARCAIVWFDELRDRPRDVMANLCDQLQLSPDPYDSYAFDAHNQAVYLRHWWLWTGYLRLKAAVARRVRPRGRLGGWVRQARTQFEKLYGALINKPIQHAPLDPGVERQLIDYYRTDVQALASVAGRPPPWLARYT